MEYNIHSWEMLCLSLKYHSPLDFPIFSHCIFMCHVPTKSSSLQIIIVRLLSSLSVSKIKMLFPIDFCRIVRVHELWNSLIEGKYWKQFERMIGFWCVSSTAAHTESNSTLAQLRGFPRTNTKWSSHFVISLLLSILYCLSNVWLRKHDICFFSVAELALFHSYGTRFIRLVRDIRLYVCMPWSFTFVFSSFFLHIRFPLSVDEITMTCRREHSIVKLRFSDAAVSSPRDDTHTDTPTDCMRWVNKHPVALRGWSGNISK